MARDRANIRVDMLSNTDYRTLGLSAQHLYKLLMIHPTLTYAGVADWRPGRIAKITRGVTADDIREAARELQAGFYVYVDDETEEVFIRSFIRHDGLLTRYRLPIAMANAYADISSPEIRRYFVHELQRLYAEEPSMKCWEEPRVMGLLKEPSEDMKAMHNGDAQPIVYAVGYPINTHELTTSATTTSTPTTTSTDVEGSGETRKKPSVKLSASWKPNETHTQYAKDNGIDLEFQAERFRNHAEASDRRMVNWDSAFRNWLLKAERTTKTKPTASSPWNQEFYK